MSTPCNFAEKFLALAALACLLIPAQAGNTMIINAEVVDSLRIDVATASMKWDLDPESSPYTKTLDKDNGIRVYTIGPWDYWYYGYNHNTWSLLVHAESSTLTDWDGSRYGAKALASAVSLTARPDSGDGTGHTVALSTSDQELVTNGRKNGDTKIPLEYVQPVSWSDEPLPTGHTYHTVLTFTANLD